MPLNDDFNFEPAPESFRRLFKGQALIHLDEIVLSWRMGGHPIAWEESHAIFQVNMENGPATLFKLHAPTPDLPARVEIDTNDSVSSGIPFESVSRLWNELAEIGEIVENPHIPIYVSLGKFSRGDRKVFMAYALTIAREIAAPPQL